MSAVVHRKVLHVVATLERAGTEMACLAIASALGNRGVENLVAAIDPGTGAMAEALTAVAGVPHVLPPGRLSRAMAFRSLCRRVHPDAVIFHFFTVDHVVLAAAARAAGVHRVVAVQGNPAPPPANRTLSRKVSLILSLSRAMGISLVSASHWIEDSLAALGSLPSRAAVIHNACPVAAIRRRAEAARAVRGANALVVTMVARLDRIKDHATLLEAFARMPERIAGRPVRLSIVGDGPLRRELEAIAARLGLAERTEFLGALGDIPERLGESDLFVLSTTRDEGFGIVLIEALAAGVPVVASDVGACREVLDGGLGRLFPQGNPETLARVLQEELENPRPSWDPGIIESRYGVERAASKYLTLLFDAGGEESYCATRLETVDG